MADKEEANELVRKRKVFSWENKIVKYGTLAGSGSAIIAFIATLGFSMTPPWYTRAEAGEATKTMSQIQQQAQAATEMAKAATALSLVVRKDMLEDRMRAYKKLPDNDMRDQLLGHTQNDIKLIDRQLWKLNK